MGPKKCQTKFLTLFRFDIHNKKYFIFIIHVFWSMKYIICYTFYFSFWPCKYVLPNWNVSNYWFSTGNEFSHHINITNEFSIKHEMFHLMWRVLWQIFWEVNGKVCVFVCWKERESSDHELPTGGCHSGARRWPAVVPIPWSHWQDLLCFLFNQYAFGPLDIHAG